MYVIMGASGNTGSVIAEKLLASKESVRVIGRNPAHLARFASAGAEAFIAEATDAGALTKAFSGATAVYAMIPPNVGSPDVRGEQERVSDAIAAATEKNGVRHVVVLSSYGADKSEGTGPVLGLHNLEKKLNGIAGLNALFIRAGYFMENILAQTSVIQFLGTTAGPLRGDLSLPMIATRDIGAAAANALVNRDFDGKRVHELQGQRDVTYDEAAKIIGAAIGRPELGYRFMGAEQLKPALMQMGMSSNMADLLLEMAGALNSGHMKVIEGRSAKNTTSTSLDTFVADTFVPAYGGKSAKA